MRDVEHVIQSITVRQAASLTQSLNSQSGCRTPPPPHTNSVAAARATYESDYGWRRRAPAAHAPRLARALHVQARVQQRRARLGGRRVGLPTRRCGARPWWNRRRKGRHVGCRSDGAAERKEAEGAQRCAAPWSANYCKCRRPAARGGHAAAVLDRTSPARARDGAPCRRLNLRRVPRHVHQCVTQDNINRREQLTARSGNAEQRLSQAKTWLPCCGVPLREAAPAS